LIGLRFANVFGILAFLLNFIPSIGSIISSFLPLPIAIAQIQGMGQAVASSNAALVDANEIAAATRGIAVDVNEIAVGANEVLGPLVERAVDLPMSAENPILFVVLVLAVPGAIQMILGSFMEPKIMGEGLNLHPVTILLALSFWGLLWGVIGMFLAAPITAVIRIVLMQFETLKPVGNLLAGKLPEVKPVAGELPEAKAVDNELPEQAEAAED
jgi:hypothetical protein